MTADNGVRAAGLNGSNGAAAPRAGIKDVAETVPAADPETEACPACGNPERRKLFDATDRLCRTTREKFEIVECTQCRLIRLYPRPRSSARACTCPAVPGVATPADRLERSCRHFMLGDHVQFVRGALEHAGGNGPVLDISNDGGFFRRVLVEHGIHAFGIDQPGAPYDLSAAPAAPESCAAITMLDVLEHLESPAVFLGDARALLRPGGRLILQASNCASWQFLLLGEKWSGIDVPRHLIHFRAADIDLLLECCGFDVVRRKYFCLGDNPAGLAASIAPWLAPEVRRARGLSEGPRTKLLKHLLYIGLVAAVVPFTVLEAACRAGSSVLIEARKK